MSPDLLYALALFSFAGIVGIAYGIRVTLKGQAHFDRVDRQGGSSVLSKNIMEAGYWFFQFIARFLISCRCTANQLSWVSLVFGVLAGCCLAKGYFGISAVLATFSGILDSLDGLVARLTGNSTPAGEVLDSVVDRYVEFFFFGGLLFYYRNWPLFFLITLLAMMGSFMVSYSTAKGEAPRVIPPRGNMRRTERVFYLIVGAASSSITISWFEIETPIGYPMVFVLSLIALLANISAVERFLVVAREASSKR